MKSANTIKEFEVEGGGCMAVNIATGGGLHSHDWEDFILFNIVSPVSNKYVLKMNKRNLRISANHFLDTRD